jgi:hypothetical protein
MSGLSALATLAQGGQPDAAFSRALGLAVLQQAATSLLPGLMTAPGGLSLAAGVQLLSSVSAGQPLCLMTDVDAGALGASPVGSSGAAAAAGSYGGEGSLFDDAQEGGWLSGMASKVDEALEQLL